MNPLRKRRLLIALVLVATGILTWGAFFGARSEPSLAPTKSGPRSTVALARPEHVPRPDVVALPVSMDSIGGFIATPRPGYTIRSEPTLDAPVVSVPAGSAAGPPPAFAVLGVPEPEGSLGLSGAAEWVQVLLPIRPNQRVGWVRQSDVDISHTDLVIEIDQSARRLELRSGPDVVFSAPVAIGTETNPTPVGLTYVTEVLANANPGGAYGPFAFGLALHSDTLSEFNGGPGQVGIHGTNAPSSIGQRASHGCVRMLNDDVRKLAELGVPLGTPVRITAIDGQES